MTRTRTLALALVGIGVFSATACKNSSNEALARDLDQAGGGTASSDLQLSPQAPGTKVVSTFERKSPVWTTSDKSPSAPPVRVKQKDHTPTPVLQQAPDASQTAMVQPTAPDTVSPIPAPATKPRPRQSGSGEGGRGYKSVGEVIRDAPFPINP